MYKSYLQEAEMSVFSEKLTAYVEKKGQNTTDLAKKCDIDRSTMFQYLKGKRPLLSQKHKKAIFIQLRLTPEEQEDLNQAYEITMIGEARFRQRRKVREILENLLTIKDIPLSELSDSIAPVSSLMNVSAEKIDEIILSGEESSKLFSTESEVNFAIHYIIIKAMTNSSHLNLLIQPEYEFMNTELTLPEWSASPCMVTQIICMDSCSGQDDCLDNLGRIQQVLRSGTAIKNYEPLYFYSSAAEHYGIMNLMPNLILTDHCALQISSDRKAAILHAGRDIIGYFFRSFQKMKSYCNIFMEKFDGLASMTKWWSSATSELNFEGGYEMCSGLCSIQFWDEYLINKYINKDLPGCDTLINTLLSYTSYLYSRKMKTQTTVIMNPSYVIEFIRTGRMKEYPALYFNGCIEPEDRRYLIEKILEATKEGWYHIHFMRPEIFPIDQRWELASYNTGKLALQYSSGNQFRMFLFQERDVVDAFYDYLESISSSADVCDTDEAAAQLQSWISEYLPDNG